MNFQKGIMRYLFKPMGTAGLERSLFIGNKGETQSLMKK
jgi:hypothetical protein